MITDDTLREGAQNPGISFTVDEKLKLAKSLSAAGVRRAMVSYPAAHSSEFEVAQKIAESKLFDEVFGLGRTMEADIDLIYETGADISLHLPFDIQDLDKISHAVKYASQKDRTVEVGVVDIIKHSKEELHKLVKLVAEAGADVVQLPDTTGIGTPRMVREIIKDVKSTFDVKVEVHCHNDLGLAMANTMAGIEGGADYIETSMMGLGERNGIADLASVVSALESDGVKTGIRIDKLRETYDILMGMILDKVGLQLFVDNMPVFGRNTSVNTAGTHSAFSNVFSGKGVSVNVYTGKHMIRNILKSRNIELPDDKLAEVVSEIKDRAVSSGRTISVDEIVRIAGEES